MISKVTETAFRAHVRDYDGICLACGEWTCGDVEPDADSYECEECGALQVMGAENALVAGKIEIVEEATGDKGTT